MPLVNHIIVLNYKLLIRSKIYFLMKNVNRTKTLNNTKINAFTRPPPTIAILIWSLCPFVNVCNIPGISLICMNIVEKYDQFVCYTFSNNNILKNSTRLKFFWNNSVQHNDQIQTGTRLQNNVHLTPFFFVLWRPITLRLINKYDNQHI